jgi:hypothetical protein
MDLILNDFSPFTPTPLCKIMGDNKSDKGSIDIEKSWHNYTTFYYSIFKDLREKPLKIFELGLGTNNLDVPSNMGVNGRPCASLYGWREFFVNSHIYGADIDARILHNDDKITTFYCDQTRPDIICHMWNNPLLNFEFDIIIEDGLHTYDAAVCFFENSIHKLKDNGYYIIEDISNKDIQLFKDKIIEWKKVYKNLSFKLLSLPTKCNPHDNNLLVVFRLTGN